MHVAETSALAHEISISPRNSPPGTDLAKRFWEQHWDFSPLGVKASAPWDEGAETLCLFSKRPQGTQYRQIPGSIRSYETTHTSDNPMLSAELEKVTLPQGDWQSSQEMTPRTENYLMRSVRVSHLGLESHVRWSKKVCSMPFMKQNWSTKPYFLIFGFYISRKLIPKPREVLTGSFSLSVTGTLWSQHITALSTM